MAPVENQKKKRKAQGKAARRSKEVAAEAAVAEAPPVRKVAELSSKKTAQKKTMKVGARTRILSYKGCHNVTFISLLKPFP